MNKKTKNILAFVIIAIGILFVGIGVFRDETEVVLRKAVNICLECIGIG